MYHMLQNGTTWRTAEVFFLNPGKAQYLKGISRKIGLAHTSVKKSLNELVRRGLVKETVEKKGKRRFPLYIANTGDKLFYRHKVIYNITSLIESGLIEHIENKLAPRSIVVFGSYRRGEDAEDSDIDIFVECEKEKLDLARFERKLSRNIELHFNENFSSYPQELKNSIINGIVLSGFLEGYK